MGKVVDQKVVEMRFDNGQFEKGVSQSMSSLDKLKASLNGFSGDFGSGLNSLAGNFVQFNSTVNSGQQAFSALQQVGVGALRAIGEAAVSAGQSYVQNFLNKVKAGWSRYEEMMKSTQTIMYATRNEWEDQGEQMEYVNTQIEKLQWYTDETSYNLSDMTSNVGKFIAAGIPLEDAVSNMMGIASWAALSGQGAEQASRAMYNLSQAMGQGALTMIDWRSIENANMATREFKQIAIETGIEFGKIWEGADGLLYTYDQYMREVEINVDNFRTTLSGKWLDSDVLSATLDRYGEFPVELNKYVDIIGVTTTEMIGIIDDAIEKGINDIDWEENAEEGQRIIQELAKEAKISTEDMDLFSEAIVRLTADEYELGRAAFKAGQESKTLTDSLEYTKDALATAYNNIFQAIIGDYLESKEVWTQFSEMLYTWLVEPVEEFRDMLMEVKSYGGFDHLKNALLTIYETVTTIKETVSDTIGGVLEKYHIGNKARSLLDILIKIDEFAQSISLQDWVWGSDIENITTAAETLGRVIAKLSMDLDTIKRSAKKAWETVFPKKDTLVGSFTDSLVEAANALEKWFDNFRMDPENADKITEIFENILTVVKNFWDTIKGIAGAIKDAWDQIFPKKAGPDADTIIDKIHSVSETIVNLSNSFKMTDEKADKLKRTFAGVFAILDIFKQLFVSIVSAFHGGNGEVMDFTDAILTVTAAVGDWIVSIRDWLAENDTFKKVVQTIKDFLTNIPVYAEQASQALFGMSLSDLWEKIKQAASDAWETIKEIFNNIVALFTGSSGEVEGSSEGISEALPNEESAEPVVSFAEKVSGALEKVKEVIEAIKPYIDEFTQMLQENEFTWPSLENLGEAGKTGGVIAILAGIAAIIWNFVRALTRLDKDKEMIVKSIQYMFRSIGDAAKALKQNIQAHTFKTIATAILEIAAAIFILALLPMDKVGLAGTVIAGLLGELAYVFQIITGIKASEKRLKQIRLAIDALAVILAVIIAGIFVIATQTDITNAIAAATMLGILLIEVAAIFLVFDNMKANKAKTEQLIKLMATLSGLIFAMGTALMMATMFGSWEQLVAAGGMMALMLAEIGLFLVNIDKVKVTEAKVKNLIKLIDHVAVLLVAMGAALMIATLTGADWTQLAAAGAAMSAMMLAVALAIRIMPDKTSVQQAAEAMLIASVAFVMMGAALMVATMGGADWTQLGAAGLIMSVMMLALAAAFRVMPSGPKIIEAAAALLIASVSLVAIAGALRLLSGMSLEQIGIALLALAGGLVAVLLAGLAATYIGPGLIVIGVAMALIGASALMAGTGMWLFASALSMLFDLDASGIDTMIAAIGAFFDEFPAFMTKVGEGIMAFLQVFSDNSSALYEMFVSMATLLVDAYRAIMPQVVAAVTETIVAVVQAYRTVTPLLIAAFTETIVLLLESARTILPELMIFLTELFYEVDAFIRTTAPQMVDTVFYVLTLLFDGLVQWVNTNLPKLREFVNFIITELCNSIRETTYIISDTAIQMLKDALHLVMENIGEITELLVEIAIETVNGFIKGLTDEIPNIVDTGIEFVLGLINGIADGIEKHAEDMRLAMENLATSLINAFLIFMGMDPDDANAVSTKFLDFGKNVIQGLIDGISSMVDDVWNAAKNIGETLVNAFSKDQEINSPSKLWARFGKYIDQGLANGLRDNVHLVSDASHEVSDRAIEGISDVISNIGRLVEEGIDAEPTIRPVMDLTNITEGFEAFDNMLAARKSTDLAIRNESSIAARITPEERFNNLLSEFKASVDSNKSPTMQTNTFNINGARDPKAIADEVSSIIQNQVDRRNAVWA